MSSLAKQGVLRGRGEFTRVLSGGRRVSSGFLRASYVANSRDGEVMRCGISVARETGNAVRRNRVRRLIREAIRSERQDFCRSLRQAGTAVDVVLRFTPGGVVPVRQLSFQQVQPEVRKIFHTIATRVTQGKS